ncbi:MAG: hypothetical protein U0527_03165 [Candidatus Eisenbacteria bacterium]
MSYRQAPIFISTGCVSADRVTIPLIRELRARGIDSPIRGLVGPMLAAEGVESLADLTELSSIGPFGSWGAALRHLGTVTRGYRSASACFSRERPRLAILVDNPGQNIPLLQMARRFRVPSLYYVTPQDVWAARMGVGTGAARTVASLAQSIANVFEFEPPFFQRHGAHAEWVGHPLIDILRSTPRPELRGRTIGLFPGSRHQEVRDLLPILRRTAEALARRDEATRFVISSATEQLHRILTKATSEWNAPVAVYNREPYRVLSQSDLLIACSGTATLEAAILGLPMVVIYRVHHPIDRALRPLFVRSPFFAMPNVLAGRQVVPELIGHRANPEQLVREASALLGDTPARRRMLIDLEATRQRLGPGGAIRRTADLAQRLLEPAAEATVLSAAPS